MRFVQNLKIGVKLPLMLVVVGLTALAIMGVGAYRQARDLLEVEAEARLERTLDTRAEALEGWAGRLTTEVDALADQPATGRALREFTAAWKRLGKTPDAYLRTLYQAENPHPFEKRAQLEDAGDVTDYAILHRRYHPGFVAEAERKGFLDVMLIDAAGRVVYSMAKAEEFASDLKAEGVADGALAALVRAALAPGQTEPLSTDFLPDPAVPDHRVILYLASPVRAVGAKPVGVVVTKVAVDRVSAVLGAPTSLGETGQGYLVGPDDRLRNNLRLAEGPTLLEPLAGAAQSAALAAARRGERGEVILTGQTGEPALAAYRPIRLFAQDFVGIVEQDVPEFSAPATQLARDLVVISLWLAGGLAVVSWLLARSLAGPLERVGRAVRAIAQGNLDTEVQHKDRGDEVGRIACALEELRADLAGAEQTRLDALIQGTAFEACSAAMLRVDSDFRVAYANASFKTLVIKNLAAFRSITLDLDPEALIGRTLDAFHSMPDLTQEVLRDPSRLPYHADIVVGEVRFGLDISAVEVEGRGHFGFVVEWRDVTELRMNRALLNALDANQLICEFTPDGRIARVNGNLSASLETPAELVIGRERLGFIDGVGDIAGFWDSIENFEPVLGRFRLRRDDGGEILVEGSVTPVPDRNNRMLKIVLIGNDVTEVERRLAVARETAEAMQARQREVVDALRVGLGQLSEGDLGATIERAFAPEYEQLRADFNQAVATLAQAIQTVIDNAATIDGEAREITNAAEDLSHRTEQQAATLEQTAAALNQLTSSVNSASSGAAEADRVVGAARQSAVASGEIVQQAVSAMGEIEESSTKISRIISVIDDIAFQTNLLALNAGVEAARAGEAGRGFAVVASEVRALAQRSSEAAREIDGLISASTEQVRRGVDLVGETGQALQGILGAVTDIAARVSDIAESAREQATGLAEINIAVNQLDQVTQQNAAMFEETTAASHALSQGARELAAATARFRTGAVQQERAAVPRRTPAVPKPAQGSAGPTKPAPARAAVAQVLAPAPEADSWEEF